MWFEGHGTFNTQWKQTHHSECDAGQCTEGHVDLRDLREHLGLVHKEAQEPGADHTEHNEERTAQPCKVLSHTHTPQGRFSSGFKIRVCLTETKTFPVTPHTLCCYSSGFQIRVCLFVTKTFSRWGLAGFAYLKECERIIAAGLWNNECWSKLADKKEI